nr:PAS domain-containing protein [uncultured Sphingomonas sp.]
MGPSKTTFPKHEPAAASGLTDAERVRLNIMASHGPDSLIDDPELKAITDFAAQLCDTEIALVGMVERERQWFLAREGLDMTETPRSVSFCQFTMVNGGIMEVTDATTDPRFADNVLVTGPPFVRFYAGAPLLSEEGATLGALCVISSTPRPSGLTDLQRHGLAVLARAVMRRMKDKRAQLALETSERRFEALSDAIPQLAWSTTADGEVDYFNARWYSFTGADDGQHNGSNWVDVLHPDDRDMAVRTWRAAVRSGDPYEIEYRMRRQDGLYRWTLARGLPMRDADGEVIRWFGTNTDVHEQRELSESRDVLSRELSHRIKNIFSVISGLIGLESRAHPGMEVIAENLRDRIVALGRAHDYVRPHGADEEPTSLHGLLDELFEPYGDGKGHRVNVEGSDLSLGERAVTPIALLFHEMATNAAKYGALSKEGGQVTLNIRRDGDDVRFDWTETGGPRVDGPRDLSGFGSQLVDMSVKRQLGGNHEVIWAPEGLKATITVPVAALI